MVFFDDLETRSLDERDATLVELLPRQVAKAKTLEGYKTAFSEIIAQDVTSASALAHLPVLRKSDLSQAQSASSPLGGFTTRHATGFGHIFQLYVIINEFFYIFLFLLLKL